MTGNVVVSCLTVLVLASCVVQTTWHRIRVLRTNITREKYDLRKTAWLTFAQFPKDVQPSQAEELVSSGNVVGSIP